VKLGGDKRKVAVLFSDIRGFTALSETMSADTMAKLLTEYFTEMVECVFRHGGTLDKFIGDAVMAQWGAPIGEHDDCDRAMQAALDMMEELDRLNARWRSEGRPVLQIGIGLNVGDVFAGNIGSDRRLEYTVIGDPVNVSSRLCGAAGPGEILLSEYFRNELGSPPPLESLPPDGAQGEEPGVAGLPRPAVTLSAIVAPNGYERFDVGPTVVVARVAAAAGLRRALQGAASLHAWAEAVPGGRTVPGPCDRVGRPASRRRDRRGRAARAAGRPARRRARGPLRVAGTRALGARDGTAPAGGGGAHTPDVVAYALYPAGPGLCRCDVATRRLPVGAEFPVSWRDADASSRETMLIAVGTLLRDLRAAGAQHADLNAKNLFLARDGNRWAAWVLDVDRVRFRAPNDPEVGDAEPRTTRPLAAQVARPPNARAR
jgi:class 3 adenylate cyclase